MIIENENDTVSSLSHNNIINVCINQNTLDINYWSYVFSNKEEREHLIELGKTLADNYIIKINNNDISNNIINTTQDISFNLNDIKVENIVYKPSN
jgi:hypothetical protein